MSIRLVKNMIRKMQFNVPCVYEYLEDHGFVYTVRAYLYKTHFAKVDGIGTVRRTKIGDVHERDDLEDFVYGSGFASIDEWWTAIQQFTKSKKKYLYKVEVVYD